MILRTASRAVLWSEVDLERISRRLHDEVGPSLCAAGLQLSFLEQSLDGRATPDAKAAIDALRTALESATGEVRTLSYLADPTIVPRLGFEAAVSYLTRAYPVASIELDTLAPRRDKAAAGVFAALKRLLAAWHSAAPGAQFSLHESAACLYVGSGSPPPDSLLERSRPAASAIGWSGQRAVLFIPAPSDVEES